MPAGRAVCQKPDMTEPQDAEISRSAPAVEVYPPDSLPQPRLSPASGPVLERIEIAPRDARAFEVKAGQGLSIVSVEGPQVGDLNLWSADLSARFYSGKTRALHGTHLGPGDRMWSSFPGLRPLATVVEDTLGWYGIDADGCSVHDVIGTRCDPYTHARLTGGSYDHCCHSNLTRALVRDRGHSVEQAEGLVHDVLNVFMCTGFSRATGRYIMKASPVRPGDRITLRAEEDLVAALSACPGGDCGAGHSSDEAPCFPLMVEIMDLGAPDPLPDAPYRGAHGL